MRRMTLVDVLAILLGGSMAAVEVWGTYGYFLKDQGEFNYIVAVMCGVTIFTALAPLFIVRAWSARRWGTCVFLAVALPVAVGVTFAAAVSRTGGTADDSEATRIRNERKLTTATEAEKDAKAAYDAATAAAKKECADGRGRRCDTAEERQESAAARLDKARESKVIAEDPKKDPFYSRMHMLLARLGWNVSEDELRMYWPIVYPLAMALCAGASIAFGVPHGPAPEKPAQPRRAWRLPRFPRRKEKAPATTVESPSTPPAEVPSKPADVDVAEVTKQSPFRHAKPTLKLVASNTTAQMHGILDFIIDGLESGSGTRVSEKDVYKGYADRCRAAGMKPASAEEFAPLLDKACIECNIERTHKSGKVYLMDVQLVNKSQKAS